jgi:hypothetical protein
LWRWQTRLQANLACSVDDFPPHMSAKNLKVFPLAGLSKQREIFHALLTNIKNGYLSTSVKAN